MPLVSFDRVRTRFIARGGIERAEPLARRPKIPGRFSAAAGRRCLEASLNRAPEATRQSCCAQRPTPAAPPTSLQLPPRSHDRRRGRSGKPAMAVVMAGRPVPGGGNPGRSDLLAHRDRERPRCCRPRRAPPRAGRSFDAGLARTAAARRLVNNDDEGGPRRRSAFVPGWQSGWVGTARAGPRRIRRHRRPWRRSPG